MKQLSREAFQRTRAFLMAQGRPLDRALFAWRFKGSAASEVVAELARFQNEDGGFGHALEADVRTPASSALATGIGLLMLVELDCPADHPMVRGAVNYLLSTLNSETLVWRAVPPGANAYPHAPWWHDEDGSLARLFDGCQIIPRAHILGSLHHFPGLFPETLLSALTEETVKCIEQVEVLGAGGGSDLRYAVYLAEAEYLPHRHATRLRTRIEKSIPAVVVRDPAKWGAYGTTPLRLVTSPKAIGADLIQDELQAHLDFVVEYHSPEGTWEPDWTWGGVYPEAWEQARQDWRSQKTLETLTILHAFGRIEDEEQGDPPDSLFRRETG